MIRASAVDVASRMSEWPAGVRANFGDTPASPRLVADLAGRPLRRGNS